MASPSSRTAGKAPPAVQPPVEAENSVRTTAPDALRRTSPTVAATAASERGSSSEVRVALPDGRVQAPP